MSLTITQETFDIVFKESVEEFEMAEEEDSYLKLKNKLGAPRINQSYHNSRAFLFIKIFTRVNLSNVMMACSSAIVVVECIKTIEKLLNKKYPERDDDISHELTILKVELDKGLPVKVRAGKEGLYKQLIACLSKMEPKYLLQVLETLTSLTDGYPDLLDKSGLDFMIALVTPVLMRSVSHLCEKIANVTPVCRFLHDNVDIDLIVQNLKWIKNCVTANEKNRSELISMKIQDKFRHLLQTYKHKGRLVIQVCQATRKLVSDDDIRVIHGNPHEHARELANETLCIFISFLENYKEDICVLYELIPTVAALIIRDEFCIKVYERNGLRSVLDIMIKYPDDEKINRHCLCLLRGLAGSDYVKEPIIQNGAAPLIVSAMHRHKFSPSLVASGCLCISALALRSPGNAQSLVNAGSPDLLVTAMNMYRENHVILKNGCWAIRNIVARSHEFRSKFTALNAELLLNEARKKFPKELDYEARITLKDLGCGIEEDFLWLNNSESEA